MRKAVVNTLMELAERDPRVLLLTGDLGFMVFEPFMEKHPDRFFNVGVAEQNMVGLATGLAEAGFIPFVYSIVTFASLRPYEFIRNGPIGHRLPVRVIGVGGGFDYAQAGASHHGLEDVGVMRVQPGITVVVPADHRQAREAILKTWDLPGPVYFRIEKDDKNELPGLDGRFEVGEVQKLRDGNDVLIFSMGGISFEALAAAETLAEKGVGAAVAVVSCLNPAPEESLAALLRKYPAAITVEEHYAAGGLGSLVSETIARNAIPCKMVQFAVKEMPGKLGGKKYLRAEHGLTRENIISAALGLIKNRKTHGQ